MKKHIRLTAHLYLGSSHTDLRELQKGRKLLNLLLPHMGDPIKIDAGGMTHEKKDNKYGEIRFYLQSRGTPIGPLDMLIAAQRLPNLEIENWAEENEQ